MFERITNYAIKNFTYSYKHNNAAYAKLGMGPLWKEIMANILPLVDSDNPAANSGMRRIPKLALFSGHDTTLMPILATLGDDVWDGTEWAPYASMIQIEIHRIYRRDGDYPTLHDFPSGYAFRLIYNGKVLTSKMDGCASGSELCDSRVLVKQVMPFAKYNERNCASTRSVSDNLMTEMETAVQNMVATPGGVGVVILLVMISFSIGVIVMYYLTKRGLQRTHGYRESLALGDLSMRVMDGNDSPSSSIDSAVPAKYGATNGHGVNIDDGHGVNIDENTLI